MNLALSDPIARMVLHGTSLARRSGCGFSHPSPLTRARANDPPDRRDHSPGAALGSLLIGNAFAMGWTGRATVLVARTHGNPPSGPRCSDESDDDADDPASQASREGACASVKERSGRRCDDHVALTRRGLGCLNVPHGTVLPCRLRRPARADPSRSAMGSSGRTPVPSAHVAHDRRSLLGGYRTTRGTCGGR